MSSLIVSGILRANQFWPQGRSDADTATIELTIQGKKSFVLVDDAGNRRTTNVFENAEVIGQARRSQPNAANAKGCVPKTLLIS